MASTCAGAAFTRCTIFTISELQCPQMSPAQPTHQFSSPDQVRASLSITESELTLQEQKLATYLERQTKERGFIALLARKVLDKAGETSQVTNDYLRTHKAHSDAVANEMRLQIEKLKGAKAVLQGALDNLSEGPPKAPLISSPGSTAPGGRLLVPGAVR